MRCAYLLAVLSLSSAIAVPPTVTGEPGGDVLRPEGRKRSTMYLGMDFGLHHARYIGDLTFQASSPFRPDVLIWAPFSGGSGVGWLLNGTIDVPLSLTFGLVGKVGYISRTDRFSISHVDPIFYTDPATGFPAPATLESDFDMDVSFINVDILLRYQIQPESWYVLGGVSFSNLTYAHGPFSQKILSPDGVSYANVLSQPTGVRAITGSYDLVVDRKSRMAVKAGAGTWIPVGKKIFLTPEACIDYPLSKFIEAPGRPLVFIPKTDVTFLTVSFTLGIRFGL